MNYQEAYEKAVGKGAVEQVTTSIYKFDEEGQKLIGKLVSTEPFTEGEFETEVTKYTIDTDAGLVSCVLGSATDKQLTRQKLLGKLVCITFYGKVTLKDGRQVNRYGVEVF